MFKTQNKQKNKSLISQIYNKTYEFLLNKSLIISLSLFTAMENYPLLDNKLTLKGINIQNIRISRARKRDKKQIQYTPLQIQPKSLNKCGTLIQRQSRASSYSRNSQKNQIKYFQTRNSIPNLEQIKTPSTHDSYHLKRSQEIKVQKYIQRQITTRKKTKIQTEIGLKKMSFVKVKKCICGDCQQCLKDFTYFLHIFSNDQSIPQISAKSWCIWRKNKINNKFMHYYGKRIHKVREVASLTKIVTSMTTIDYLSKYDLDPSRVTYQIRKPSVMIGGTTAGLQIGQVYTITELLYAMMLPSGNDAAIALSQVIGLLHNIKIRNKQVDPYKQSWYCQFLSNPNKSYSYHFIALMNQKCQKIGLLDTHMYNSHGNDAYDQLKNVSTCNQIAKMSSQYMLKYDYLKNIVHTKIFQVPRYSKTWENTNKLLQDGFQGIKTGITQSAGPCLSACYKDLIVIVLNSKSMNQRWIQVKKLVRWIVRKGG